MPSTEPNHRGVSLLKRLFHGATLTALVVVVSGFSTAQSKSKPVAQNPGASTSFASGISLGAIDYAQRTVDCTITQRRRFLGPTGVPVTVREEVKVDADGTDAPPYELTYLGVEGEQPGSPLWQQWAQNYTRFASLYHQHGGFRVRNLPAAQSNYTVHNFGQITRAGRSACRIVVLPNRFDKAVWLVDVDATTFLPLYAAEYDSQLRLLSEVEVVTFSTAVQLTNPRTPSMTVTPYQDFAAAEQAIGGKGLVEPQTGPLSEYVLSRIHGTDNPLNGRHSMVLTYTDGIDECFVIESPGVPEYFAGLPSQIGSGLDDASGNHTIARYRDPSMSVLLFWYDGVGFQIAGRGSLRRLDEFAKTIYAKAVTGR